MCSAFRFITKLDFVLAWYVNEMCCIRGHGFVDVISYRSYIH